MYYGLSKEEKEELEELKAELFGENKLVAFEDFEDHTKTQRYDQLMQKKFLCRQMTLN